MALLIQWTGTWANVGRWGGTGRPGVLQSMGLGRVTHKWVTERKQVVTVVLIVQLRAMKSHGNSTIRYQKHILPILPR